MTKINEKEVKELMEAYKEDDSYIEDLYSKWDKFLEDFSQEKLKDLIVDKYVVGKGESTFCHRIEWTLKDLGSIRGSNATKYGIYYGRTKSDSTAKYRPTRKFGGDEVIAFENVKTALISLISDAMRLQAYKEIPSNLSNLFKNKIIFVYNKKVMIPIFNKEHLDFYIDVLDIKCGKSFEAEQKALIEYKNKLAPKKWDNRKFMAFLYNKIWPYRFEEFFYEHFEKDNDFNLNVSTELSHAHKPKKQKESGGTRYYPRDKEEASKAYVLSGMKCEFDNSHKSFTSARTGKKYLECHHLIPMSLQRKYKKISIDVAQNIVCLCSDCHNRIHYGNDRNVLIEKLFNDRKQQLEEYGVSITLDELKKYY